MTTYVALLRGINLGRHNQIGMPALRDLFGRLGYGDVSTYLQSGNVVFRTKRAGAKALRAEIEQAISDDLGLTVDVLLRTRVQLDRVIAGNPFVDTESDHAKLLVTFLAGAPPPRRVGELDPEAGGGDRYAVQRLEVYLHCPNGYGRSKLDNAFFERRLGVAATTRNWRTVLSLGELAAG